MQNPGFSDVLRNSVWERSGSKWAFPSCVPVATAIPIDAGERDRKRIAQGLLEFALLCAQRPSQE